MVRRNGKFVWHRPTLSGEVLHRFESAARLLQQKERKAVKKVRDTTLLVLGTVVTLLVYGPVIRSGFVALGGTARPRP